MSKNKTNKGKQQHVPVCIFCKSTPVTEEHLWPKWIEKEFPREGKDKHTVGNYQSLSEDGSKGQYNTKVSNRHIIRISIKRVCASCNNGWMSRIETESKETIKSLILDEPIVLGNDQKNKISRWGVLKSIIGEYADYQNLKVAISQKERFDFCQTNDLSTNFKIYIGRSLARQGIWKAPFFAHYTAYMNPNNLKFISPPNPNVQWSFFVKDTFVLIVYWSQQRCDLVLPSLIRDKLFQIYPSPNISFNYHFIPTLSEQEMNYIRENLTKHSTAVIEDGIRI